MTRATPMRCASARAIKRGTRSCAALPGPALRRQELEARSAAFVARIEATDAGPRYPLRRHLAQGHGAKHLYETVYCARGQAENFIKLHKAQLASDRTSCRDPRANQFRLILHTAAYWLMLALRKAVPQALAAVARGVRNTLRLRLIKIAARVVEGAARIRVWLPTACPDARCLSPSRRTLRRRRTLTNAALSPHPARRRNLQPRKIKPRAPRHRHRPMRSQLRARAKKSRRRRPTTLFWVNRTG